MNTLLLIVNTLVVSFFKFENDRILTLDEYWGECGDAPQWRLDKKIGKKININKT